jgi:hypothetical protein
VSRRTAADDSTRARLLARELWTEAFSVQRKGVDLRAGLAGAIACCTPLALGVALGEEAIGVTASFGV